MRRLLVTALLGTLGLIVGCGGGSSTPSGVPLAAQNVQPIAVDGGPVATQIYPNGAFTSVTICLPGTSTCQTIDGVLVDTGSYGLRILSSAITLSGLPQVSVNNAPAYDCVSFLDMSFLWGPVVTADVKMAGEVASNTSIHVLEDPTAGSFTIPTQCSNGGTDEDNQAGLGANGILGVGPEPFDCGAACDPSAGGTPPEPAYYTCTSSCMASFVPEAQQVTNPVVNFSSDNNGVIVELPSLSGAAATVSGSMIFGIGTQSNNGLGSATVFTLDQSDNFTTVFNAQTLTSSFIDSGSNGLFFPNSFTPPIATCADLKNSFYCPASPLTNLIATNQGTNSASNQVTFTIDNADNLFSSNPSDAAFSTLGGPNSGGFDWGLPFFYGRNVFTAIDGQNTPAGVGPYWAY